MKATRRNLITLGAIVAAGLTSGTVQAATTITPPINTPPAHAELRGPGGSGGPIGWAAFDVNKDGSVTAEEFVTAGDTLAKERQANFLAKYDSVPTGQTAGDGIITTAEAKAVFDAQAADWLKHILETFDTNGDGAISSADQVPTRGRRGESHLDALDTNDDGTVSAEELAAAAAAMSADRLKDFLAKFDSVPTGATAGDGVITVAESLAVFEDEVVEQVKAVLARYDSNKDGSVSAAEIAAADAARPGNRGGPGGRGRR